MPGNRRFNEALPRVMLKSPTATSADGALAASSSRSTSSATCERRMDRLREGVKVRVAMRPFEAETKRGVLGFGYGTIVVPTGIQDAEHDVVRDTLRLVAEKDGLDVHSVQTGLTPSGIDLGSPNVRAVEAPRAVLLVGSGVSAYEAGEVWHLLDQRYRMELSMIELSSLWVGERHGQCDFGHQLEAARQIRLCIAISDTLH